MASRIAVTQADADKALKSLRETHSRTAAMKVSGLPANVVGKLTAASGLGKNGPSKAAEKDRRIVTEVWGIKLPRASAKPARKASAHKRPAKK